MAPDDIHRRFIQHVPFAGIREVSLRTKNMRIITPGNCTRARVEGCRGNILLVECRYGDR